jgi:hypothetical protein
MQKRMKVAVMVASLGFMTVGHADNLPSGKTPTATSTTTTTTTTSGKEGTQATTSTTDQVLVGGSASSTSQTSQTSNNQGLVNQHDHGHDEDMD